ncbi:MAG TPA: DUF488 domain-containing protein [Pseudacidobacterium sp.]|nr:DUF488 domain-containing protein [Pseudacidobacterium sp.]
MIQLKRAYDPASPHDGRRFLVERLWPRGIRKEDLLLDDWIKDAAPSTELRKWFHHDPEKWKEFQRRYFTELDSRPEVLAPILKAARHGCVTLIFSSHDAEHNNAVALKSYLESHSAKAGRKSIKA